MNIKLTLKELLTILVLMPAATIGICIFCSMVKADYDTYIQESECVQELVKIGVPRFTIDTGNGGCWINTNGYGE